MSIWILIGSISGFIGVGMGAFGAHGLSQMLSTRGMEIYQTAAQYQMYHAVALVAFGAWAGAQSALPGWCFALGTLIFSGSLYALAITDVKILGAITPIGGLFFLAGWASLAWQAWKAASGGAGG